MKHHCVSGVALLSAIRQIYATRVSIPPCPYRCFPLSWPITPKSSLNVMSIFRRKPKDSDTISIAQSIPDSLPPSYSDIAPQAPPYTNATQARHGRSARAVQQNQSVSRPSSACTAATSTRRSANTTDSKRIDHPQLWSQGSFLRSTSSSGSSSPGQSNSLATQSSRSPNIQRHDDHGYHRLHGITDSRMHAKPARDSNGTPIRNKSDLTAGKVAVGAAVGIVALSACNIM